MRIAVIGKGNIGGSLGTKWHAAGHDVVYGVRDGSGEGPGGAPVRGIGDALKDADVVVLAVPGQVVADPDARATAEELIRAVGLEPAFLGDANATTTVDGLLPLWFALVQQNGGNRRVALRIITEG